MSAHPDDRALAAVRRVRESREKDSRFGLQHALTVVQARQQELRAAQHRRSTAEDFTLGSVADFAGHLAHLAMLAEVERKATVRAADSRLIADEATTRWQRDRQQVRAVEGLLDRRAAARAEERGRREAHQLDDIATQAWLRRQAASLRLAGRSRQTTDSTHPDRTTMEVPT